VCPAFVFVVVGVMAQAAVQDADESAAQCSQGLMVEIAGGAVRSTRSALPMGPLVGFSGPPPGTRRARYRAAGPPQIPSG
jgi:hypothetical protein